MWCFLAVRAQVPNVGLSSVGPVAAFGSIMYDVVRLLHPHNGRADVEIEVSLLIPPRTLSLSGRTTSYVLHATFW